MMKKNMSKTAVWFAALALCAGTLTTPVAAAGNEVEDKQTEATVSFNTEGISNPLRLEKVPTFDFGTHKISDADEFYNAADSVEGNANALALEVIDLRGRKDGWQVTAAITTPFAAGNQELTGSQILINSGLVSYAGNSNVGDRKKPVHNGAIILDNESNPVLILSAEKGDATNQAGGQGHWRDLLGSGNAGGVQLEVPGGVAQAANYKATVTWYLENVPAE